MARAFAKLRVTTDGLHGNLAIVLAVHSQSFNRYSPVEQNPRNSTAWKAVTEGKMDIYQLEYVLHEPQESEGCMYLAEIPALQGAMAWGETPEETLSSLLAVAQTIIQLRREEGEALPPEIMPLRSPKGTLTVAA